MEETLLEELKKVLEKIYLIESKIDELENLIKESNNKNK